MTELAVVQSAPCKQIRFTAKEVAMTVYSSLSKWRRPSFRDICGVVVVGALFSAGSVFGKTYYVDADNYGKAGLDGTNREKAFGTLEDAFNWGTDSGTVFKVYPGVYTNGSKSACRAYMRSGVICESVEGPERTIIVGGAATTADGTDVYANGSGAIRCVKMNTGAVLRGFTLTGGHTANSSDSDLGYGGGVQAKGAANAYVIDCIISNNTAYGSAGAYTDTTTTFVNCRFLGNSSYNKEGAIRGGYLVNCIINGNTGCWGAYGTKLALNCTFGTHTAAQNVSGKYYQCVMVEPVGPTVNCIFIGRGETSFSSVKKYYTNCVFLTSMPHEQHAVKTDCATYTAEDVMLDERFCPVLGSCAAIGFGTAAEFPAAYLEYGDLYGVPRILNGSIDAGACEYDYRPHYSMALGPDVTVTNASPAVTLGDGCVNVPSGATVSGVLSAKDNSNGYSATVRTPSVTMTLDGFGGRTGARSHVAAEAAEQTFKGVCSGDFGFVFSYLGDGSGVVDSLMRRPIGFVMVLN